MAFTVVVAGKGPQDIMHPAAIFSAAAFTQSIHFIAIPATYLRAFPLGTELDNSSLLAASCVLFNGNIRE